MNSTKRFKAITQQRHASATSETKTQLLDIGTDCIHQILGFLSLLELFQIFPVSSFFTEPASKVLSRTVTKLPYSFFMPVKQYFDEVETTPCWTERDHITAALKSLQTHCQGLTDLEWQPTFYNIWNVLFRSQFENFVVSFPRLQNLKFIGASPSHGFLNNVAGNFPRLKSLSLGNNSNRFGDWCGSFSLLKLKNLETFSLSGVKVTLAELTGLLLGTPTLKNLSLGLDVKVSDSSIEGVCQRCDTLPHIKTLSLEYIHPDTFEALIATMPNLEKVKLNNICIFLDRPWVKLSKLHLLTDLVIENDRLPGTFYPGFFFPKMKRFHAAYCNLTNACVRQIACGMPNLEELSIKHNACVDQAGLRHLVQLPLKKFESNSSTCTGNGAIRRMLQGLQ